MSKRTIRVIDLLCDVFNWNGCISSNEQTLKELDLQHGMSPPEWVKEARGEIVRWSAKRNRKLAALKKTIVSLTEEDIDLIKRKYRPERLAAQLLEIGATPRW